MTTESTTRSFAIPKRGERVPLFTGRTSRGDEVRLRDFYLRRNLALVFTHNVDCEACQEILRDLVTIRPAVQAEVGEIVVVNSGASVDADLPYPILLDSHNEIHQRYGLLDANGQPRAAIFLVDRYGVVFESSIDAGAHTMLPVHDIPSWMEFIACRCS